MTTRRWATTVAALTIALVLAGCAGTAQTVSKTGIASAPISTPPSPSAATTVTASPSASPSYAGTDPHGMACAALSIDQVQNATGQTVLRVNGTGNPSFPRSDSCSWNLSPVADFAGAAIHLQIDGTSSAQTRTRYAQQFAQQVRAGKARAVPGFTSSALTGSVPGLAGSAAWIQDNQIVTLTARMSYVWSEPDTTVLLVLAPLVAAHIHKP